MSIPEITNVLNAISLEEIDELNQHVIGDYKVAPAGVTNDDANEDLIALASDIDALNSSERDTVNSNLINLQLYHKHPC